ncbi:MAG: DUF362 domain-containing protein, partial [Phycisphaerae bacterium]
IRSCHNCTVRETGPTTFPPSQRNPLVSIVRGPADYQGVPPFSPGTAFPEYPFAKVGEKVAENGAYQMVRRSLALLGLDLARFGTEAWNPLGGLIRPGNTVVLKPNFVRNFRETSQHHGDCLITHGSIIRAALDYVHIALQGSGRAIIADAPQNDADFTTLRRIAGLDEIQEFYRRNAGFDVEVYDLRPERADKIDGVIVGHSALPGDPAGYVRINLGIHSAFAEINHLCHLLYGSEYDTGEVRRHHHDDVHEYMISKTILDADCVISLPKLKTHKKVGITVSLKNLVGINGNKNWLPHHREGTPAQGGDQFAESGVMHLVERRVLGVFKRIFPYMGRLRSPVAAPLKAVGRRIFGDTNEGAIRSGNWYGNDTTWRMVLDLNRILIYADSKGMLREEPTRKLFSIVDGIIAGEGNGPLDPTPRATGVVLTGADQVAVDLACARLMGFDHCKIPLLARAGDPHRYPTTTTSYSNIHCASNCPDWHGPLDRLRPIKPPFQPHFGWRDAIGLRVDADHSVRAIAGSVRD